MRLKKKLGGFWLGSIALALLLLALLFDALVSQLHATSTRSQFNDAFLTLENTLRDRQRRLSRVAEEMAAREDILASLNMVFQYEDPARFDPMLFDGEKERLAELLRQQARIAALDAAAFYDGNGTLVAFHARLNNDEQSGHLSFSAQGPFARIRHANGSWGEGFFPDIFGEVLPIQVPSEPTVMLRTGSGALQMEALAPVWRTFPDGNRLQVGVVRVITLLDQAFVASLDRTIHLPVRLESSSGLKVGARDLPQVDWRASGLMRIGEPVSWSWMESPDHFLAAARIPMIDGQQALFLIGRPKAGLAAELAAFDQAMLAVLVVLGVVIVPGGLWLLQRLVLVPIDTLVNGVRALSAGEVKKIEGFNPRDELGHLAASFNEMVDAIADREAALQRLYQAVDQNPSAVLVTDPQGRIDYVNPKFLELSGYSEDEVIGRSPRFLKSGHTQPEDYTRLWAAITTGREWRGEFLNRAKDGRLYWVYSLIAPVKDQAGTITGFMAIQEDITQRKDYEAKLYRQSYYDQITQMPNRALLVDRLAESLRRCDVDDSPVALILADIDNFKDINETFGRDSGDVLLRQVAMRLKKLVPEPGTMARMGDDEFAILMPGMNADDAGRVASSVREALRTPFTQLGPEIFVTLSMGVTVAPQDGLEAGEMLRNADSALRRAKTDGRDAYRFFSAEMNQNTQARMDLEMRLRKAVERDEMVLHLQPILDVGGRTPVAVEALSRWHNPELGLIPPDRFIPLAEQTGLILPIGEWVLQAACREAARLQAAGFADLRVAVNVSPKQFQLDDVPALVRSALDESGLPPPSLEVELTESLLMDDSDTARKVLSRLLDLGVRLSLDDFGTGYSSLSYLSRYKFHTLKIDRSFLAGVPTERERNALVEAIIAMAHSLGLEVIAEGVETPEQMDFLAHQACDLAQGFLFSRPQPLDQVQGTLERLAATAPKGEPLFTGGVA